MPEPSTSSQHDAAPRVALAGRLWPVPLLAPRQNRVVVPAVLRLMPALLRLRGVGEGMPAAFAEAEYDDLLEVAFWALTRAHPMLTRDEFMELPIATAELIEALPVIARQSGILRRVDVPGEAGAGRRPTGIESSPASSG